MYNLFISHSWKYGDAYDKLVKLLNNASYFSYKNYSVESSNPLTIYNKNYYESELRNKLEIQMRTCHVVLILAGVYSSYSDYIQMEIEIAKELNKPIIAIEPWASERTSLVVKNCAKCIVGWNTSSIVDAIRKHSI